MKQLIAWLEAAVAAVKVKDVRLPEDDSDCGDAEMMVGKLTEEEIKLVGVSQQLFDQNAKAQKEHDELHDTEGYDGFACEEHRRLSDELETKANLVKTVLYASIEHRLGYPLNVAMRIRKDFSIVLKQKESVIDIIRRRIIEIQ